MVKKKVKKKIKKQRLQKIKREEHYTFFKIVSTRIFGNIIDKKCMKYFKSLKQPFISADMDMMFRTYLAVMFSIMTMTFLASIFFSAIILTLISAPAFYFATGMIIFPVLMTIFIFLYMYSYPTIKSNRRKVSIEANLPFAINHMAAVSESGATPYSMFKVLSEFKEYGEISDEASRMVRNVDLFGLDIISALREIISKSPSKQFKEFLEGLSTTIQTGGGLDRYLKEESKEAMFDYRVTREKYTQMISIYADFYTALLIAAPLVMIAVLAVLNTIGGSVFGLPIDVVIKIGIYVLIPLLNVIFLSFLYMTQPAV